MIINISATPIPTIPPRPRSVSTTETVTSLPDVRVGQTESPAAEALKGLGFEVFDILSPEVSWLVKQSVAPLDPSVNRSETSDVWSCMRATLDKIPGGGDATVSLVLGGLNFATYLPELASGKMRLKKFASEAFKLAMRLGGYMASKHGVSIAGVPITDKITEGAIIIVQAGEVAYFLTEKAGDSDRVRRPAHGRPRK
jgi:hypothetical protein